MKKICIILLLGCLQLSFAQKSGEKYYSKEFGWTIILPAGYETVTEEESKELEDNGLEMIEETIGQELDDVVQENTTIFMLKQGEYNSIEANFQAFDPAIDGDYNEVNETIAEVVMQTFKDQLPGYKIDMSTTTEKIGGKKFFLNKFAIHLPGDTKLNLYMYTALFGKKDLTVNVMFMEEEEGKVLLDAFKNSTFK